MAIAVSVVVPCYNEEAVLPETARRLKQVLDQLIESEGAGARSRVYFVDDGSHDRTWELISTFANQGPFAGLKLSRNCGHQKALLAGVLSVPGDVVVTVDADLQDDLGAIARMVQQFKAGHDIVLGVRGSRTTDSRFKRWSAQLYYILLKRMGADVVFDHADYRLMSRRAIEFLRQYTEVNLFLRGIIPLLGLRTATVLYDRRERYAGKSKYPLRKMLALAWDGISSFSAVPLRAISGLGVAIFVVSSVVAAWALCVRIFTTRAVPGWTSTVLPLYLLGGLQLLASGVIGEYLSKVYLESKRRPRFLIEAVVGTESDGSLGNEGESGGRHQKDGAVPSTADAAH